MNSPFSFDLNEDQNPNLDHFKNSDFDLDYASSSSNSASCPNFNVNQPPQQFSFYHMQPLNHQDQGENIYASHGEVLDHAKNYESCNKLSVCKKEDNSSSSSSAKWMSSKMRLMKKMMKSDQTVPNTSSQNPKYFHKFEEQIKGQSSSMELDDNTTKNNPNNTIRVCSDCNTTKTPLWRSGPRGPKSLCNACGIRQRKARRALAAAQESGNGAIVGATNSPTMKNKDVKSNNNNNSHLPFKKRCKFTPQARGKNSNNNNKKKLCFEDLTSIILSKNNSAYQQVFPQDEKEAAILLMALSYGLVRG